MAEQPKAQGDARVPTTIWTLVRKAGTQDEVGRAALGELIAAYRSPVYYYLRGRGSRPEQAEDLTQGFFLKLLEDDLVAKADEELGRFRHYLAAAIRRFATDEFRKATAAKRGGRTTTLSLDFGDAEASYAASLTEDMTPEHLFHARWLICFREQVSKRVRADYKSRDHGERFDALVPYLWDKPDKNVYSRLADELGMSSSNAVAVAVRRLRDRWQAAAYAEAASTCERPEDAYLEINGLKLAAAGRRE